MAADRRGPARAHDLLERPRGRAWRTNDLFTDELAEDHAELLGVAAIVNSGIDRNDLDLNRLRAVRRALAPHGEVEIFFVHGWNVIQPSCDLGIRAYLTCLDDLGAGN